MILIRIWNPVHGNFGQSIQKLTNPSMEGMSVSTFLETPVGLKKFYFFVNAVGMNFWMGELYKI